MKMWKKIKNIRIPGSIVAASLTGAILGTTMALFTVLPVAPPTVRTSEENTFGKNESLDVLIKLKSGEELHLKATGATTMDLVQSFRQMLRSLDGTLLLERSSPSTLRQEE
jgi:flagellar motor component MotA